jgi:hypothetical protein
MEIDVVKQQIESFAQALRGIVAPSRPNVLVEYGPRWARVVTKSFDQKNSSVYCFVDIQNGDIWKASSWRQPQKNGKRGNVFEADYGLHCCSAYGLKYLR